MSNFSITFSDEALSFGANIIDNDFVRCCANIDGTDYKICGTRIDDGRTLLRCRKLDKNDEPTDEFVELILISCFPGDQEIKTILIY